MGGFAIELTINFLELTILVLIFGGLFRERYESKWVKFAIVLAVALFIQVLGLILGNAHFGTYLALTACFGVGLLIIYDAKPISVYLILLVLSLVIGLTDYIGMLVSTLLGIAPEDLMNPTFTRLIVASFSRFLFYFLARLIIDRIKFISEMDIRRMSQLLIIIIMNMIFLFLAADIYFSDRAWFDNHLAFIATVLLGIIILTTITVRITDSIVMYTKKERDWKAKEDEYRRQLYYLDNLQKLTQELRSQRHDFKHHIDCVSGLLEVGKNEEAKQYISSLKDSREDELPVIHTNHPYITALLNTKAMRMIDGNIQLSSNVYIPEDLHIEPLDMSIIIGNAIDNAIEACEKMEGDKRWIMIEIYVKESHLYIKVANSSHERAPMNEKGEFETSKVDNENHGFGISNIRYVVEKYDGIMQIKQPDGTFVLNVAFPLEL